ncbi:MULTISPECIES: MerR family transcriptional regulator [unclassified Rhodococcus (in: high G+C Gram-positive bacteria)]|uniref:MerR family transcriptional regulator n=1 Tax=unclassified Rhodococcus (in: high G+C Gram-positive bacteria) TaxID=192944 RepID=UPI0002A3AB81|nr:MULTISPECIES: MerR family transcriptional regulator [unclassified Rhodococcus (in: high G+C Gram-positive bacteria)]ELB86456.1 MerR family transcriptional regulator [Rhodococcus wratislaviensis IFP 2016]MBC2637418.1 MerR family transcriptional regulator [Rhodococcus sp. 3A]MBC2898149.1 MerR family transcriptional regulator [Rhodococcus sp. 4CII]
MSEESAPREPESPSVRGVYGISVAAELSGFGVSALRLYEEYGLITPGRTGGGTRRYSDYDLARLKRIAELIDAGVNLVGIGRVLDLETRTGELERDNLRLEADNAQLRAEQDPATATASAEEDTAGEAAPEPGTTRTGRRRHPASRGRTRLGDRPARERAGGDHH